MLSEYVLKIQIPQNCRDYLALDINKNINAFGSFYKNKYVNHLSLCLAFHNYVLDCKM